MPRFGYSVKVDEKTCAKAFGREMRVSPKHAREICHALRGMKLVVAKEYLQAIIAKKQAIPFKRHYKKLAHRRGLPGWDVGKYPVKAARSILKVLENAEANATYKGLDTDKLRIIHASAHRGIVIPGFRPRAFARATPSNTPTTNVEIVVKEVT
jgi:large subunit ribosomal protein L22